LFEKWIERLSKFLGSIGASALVVLMLVTGIDVVGRYVFNRPLEGAYEMSQLALAIVILLGWAYTQSVKGHVDIDILYNRFPGSVRTVLDFFVPLLSLLLFSFIAWQGISFVIESLGWHETTEMLHIPVWVFKLMISVGAISISLQFTIDIITACKRIREKA
jgi:TRAP-type C4-dicarboxylate transport system permease small subunit